MAQLHTFICLKPAFSRRSFEDCTAWKGVGEALRNSVKSSALFNEALETILPKLLRPVVVYKATCVRLYESMRAGVGLVTRVGSMEDGDDVKQLRRLERWNFGSRGLILQLRFLSLTISLDNQPRIFDTSHCWTLEPFRRSRLSLTWFGLSGYTPCYRKGQNIRAQTPSSGKSACTTTNSAYLVLVSLQSADRRACRSTILSKQCFNAYSRLSGQSP